MSVNQLTGIYGKLPLHGDFIYRNLSSNLISQWDEWLQGFIAGSKEQLGENWLDIYLTSPIWRFSFSEGVLDENSWLGVMLPSVDRVGRYFPITVLTQVPSDANLFEYMLLQESWFDKVEGLLFQSLDGECDVDEVIAEINNVPLNQHTVYKKDSYSPSYPAATIKLEFEEQSPAIVFPHLLDSFLTSSLRSYSVWFTLGSDRVEPCISVVQNLPKIGGIAAMIDGQWPHWNWPQPYKLNTQTDINTSSESSSNE